MAEDLRKLTEPQAIQLVQKLVNLFGLPQVKLNFTAVPGHPDLLGAFVAPDTIYLNPDGGQIYGYVVAHEIGHEIESMYTREQGFTYSEGEAFASFVQGLYLGTDGQIADFRCSECGQSIIRIMPDGSLKCLGCGTTYFMPILPVPTTGKYS